MLGVTFGPGVSLAVGCDGDVHAPAVSTTSTALANAPVRRMTQQYVGRVSERVESDSDAVDLDAGRAAETPLTTVSI